MASQIFIEEYIPLTWDTVEDVSPEQLAKFSGNSEDENDFDGCISVCMCFTALITTLVLCASLRI